MMNHMNVDLLMKENIKLNEEAQRYKEMWFTTNNSLAKYRKLEEEIGCPLNVRCKVLPDDYIYTFGTSMETQDNITKRKVITISKEGIYISYTIASGKERDMILSWKAYKKTWWLKADRSE